MKYPIFTLLILFIFTLISCEKERETYAIKGLAQKGPFGIGSDIVVSELDNSLIPTGKNFNSTITDNFGSFELSSIELISNYIEIKASGEFFNEVYGGWPLGGITLYSIADVSNFSNINVNVLTHLSKDRMEYLVQSGYSFEEAKNQSKKEILQIFSLTNEDSYDFNQLELSSTEEGNGILLAISSIVLGSANNISLMELLTNMRVDLKEDGILDSKTIQTSLISQAQWLNTYAVRKNMESIYSSSLVPDFEEFISLFINNTDYETEILYTIPDTETNILNLENNAVLDKSLTYTMEMKIPENSGIYVITVSLLGNVSEENIDFQIHEGWENEGSIFNVYRGNNAKMDISFQGSGSCELSYSLASPVYGVKNEIINFSWN